MVRVATWNLENLFRPDSEAGPDTDEQYQAKLTSLADTITTMNPQVLAVQEVGEPKALEDLVQHLQGQWHTALADPDGRGIRVGFLSRLALSETEQVAEYPPELAGVQVNDDGDTAREMSRPLLRARVEAEGTTITLVSCHMKSKLLTYPGGRFSPRDEGERARYAVYALHRRAAEAATVRSSANDLLDGRGQDRAVIVLGDLNDTPHAATTTLLQGPPGSEIGTGGFDRPDAGDGDRLWNLASLIPEDKRHSRTYRGRPELIDHILVSHALVTHVDTATTFDNDPGSITDQPNERRNDPGSDHRPVLADITPSSA